MRTHHPQGQAIHLMQMLTWVVAVETLLARHRLTSGGESTRGAEGDEDVQCRQRGDGGAVRGVLAAAGIGQEREDRFETLL